MAEDLPRTLGTDGPFLRDVSGQCRATIVRDVSGQCRATIVARSHADALPLSAEIARRYNAHDPLVSLALKTLEKATKGNPLACNCQPGNRTPCFACEIRAVLEAAGRSVAA